MHNYPKHKNPYMNPCSSNCEADSCITPSSLSALSKIFLILIPRNVLLHFNNFIHIHCNKPFQCFIAVIVLCPTVLFVIGILLCWLESKATTVTLNN
jgi:hypothetical protein